MSEVFTREGASVCLRPIREDDVDAIMAWINDPEITRNFAAFGDPVTRDQELAFIRDMRASKTDRLFAIERVGEPPAKGAARQSEPGLIGTAGIHRIYWPAKNGRLGLMVGKHALQGQGIGQQTMRLLVAYAFEVLKLHKVWLVHYADNQRMRHIAGKLGFVQEGVLRDEYFHQGRLHDMVRHALLESDGAVSVPQ